MVHSFEWRLANLRELGIGSLTARLLAALLRWQERNRERHHLRALDDRILRDVGLSRADIEQEVRKPFWRD